MRTDSWQRAGHAKRLVVAGAIAGIVAGIVATAAQLALWWIFSDALPGILFRDARLAAAIVMGPGVLPPPATFDVGVMLVATVAHFALSIVYGIVLAPLVAALDARRGLLAGGVFGLALFVVNMYGFTIVFPWFDAARDWITAAAHVVFGVTAAGVCRHLSAR
ncbi:sodium:proline symporter [Aromatoleum buckelii]|uniref:Sodium:proline symporter n=1 Tax=Aromatoleum buckelii TaxID=200254 RepID=A0ABX1N681_9RHOO|nr:sodium:proline symporter [Aromatoleum buckelii]MCK0510014.1 sodium:proline symporter [Aromatoleum buckelii]